MRILLRLFGLLKKYWGWSVLSLVFLIVSTGFSLTVPQLLRRAIDMGFPIDKATGKVTVVESVLVFTGVGMIIAQIIRAGFTFGQNYLSEWISQKIAYDLRNRLYDRVQRLSFAFHDKAQTGQLMSRATQDVEAVRFFVAMGAVRVIYIVGTLVAIATILFSMNVTLTLLSLICLPFVTFIAIRMGMIMRPI